MTEPTVLIADDHPLFRAALKQAVGHSFAQQSILEADSVDDMLALLHHHKMLELIFLDLHMPGNDGFSSLMLLRNHFPDITVVMVSSDEQSEIIQKSIDFGAAGFIPKSADLTEIQNAIEKILDGDIYVPDYFMTSTQDDQAVQRRQLAECLAELTPQQYKVLSMIADGQLNKQIAFELDIKETTVKKHVSAILQKLAVNNRTMAGMAFQQLTLK